MKEKKMASILWTLLLLMICPSQQDSVIYASVGRTVILPGDGVGGPNCSSVEWYDGPYGGDLRMIWPDVPPERAGRLSLLPDCSLHITNITTEEAGHYTCGRPWSGGEKWFLLILLDGVIYASVGGTVILPGDGVGGPNCSSVEWYEVPYDGIWRKIWPDVPPERAGRLSLLPDCSLHITNITTEEAGLYTYRHPLSGGTKRFRLILLDGVIYASVGGTAILPGDGVGGPNCSSVEWYEVPYGVEPWRNIWPDVSPERAGRLSLLPDCSLHITNITTEEAGHYTCGRPWSGGEKRFLLILLDGVIYSSVGRTAILPGDGVGGPNCSSVEWRDNPAS
ncbi:uncharacterized protein LOC134464277 [Engraulis encrasicolus]|uniref:uncharacterized protein LOC134464277 n=1 Tax=Engraulis encrasicolus TaxID=184585 RepID=UPI002FCF6E7A